MLCQKCRLGRIVTISWMPVVRLVIRGYRLDRDQGYMGQQVQRCRNLSIRSIWRSLVSMALKTFGVELDEGLEGFSK